MGSKAARGSFDNQRPARRQGMSCCGFWPEGTAAEERARFKDERSHMPPVANRRAEPGGLTPNCRA